MKTKKKRHSCLRCEALDRIASIESRNQLFSYARAALRAPPDESPPEEKDALSGQNSASKTEEPETKRQPEPILKAAFLQALLPGTYLNALPVKEREAQAFCVFIQALVASRECGETFYHMATAGSTADSVYAIAFLRGALCAALILKRLEEEKNWMEGQ